MKDKLYFIFEQRLSNMRQKVPDVEIQKIWSEYLDKLKIERQGKLMSMIIPCSDAAIEFLDPLGNEAKIRINKEQAIKITTLGFIPEETQ